MYVKAFKQLLPRAQIFFDGDRQLDEAIESLTAELERFENSTSDLCEEIPGNLVTFLDRWASLLFRKSDYQGFGKEELNQSVILKLGKSEGCNVHAIEKQANRVSRNKIKVLDELLTIKFFGLEMSVKDQFSSESFCNSPLVSFNREENLISQMKYIVHAHIEDLYFDSKGTNYAQD